MMIKLFTKHCKCIANEENFIANEEKFNQYTENYMRANLQCGLTRTM